LLDPRLIDPGSILIHVGAYNPLISGYVSDWCGHRLASHS